MMSIDYKQESQSVFMDETAFAAFMNPKNPHYMKARSLFLELDDLDRGFVTTNYIVFDIHQWLRNEFGYDQADFFLNTVEKAANRGRLTIIPGSLDLESDSRRLLLERPELEYSLSEALTAVIMSSFGIRRIFTFNRRHHMLKSLDKSIKIIPRSW